MRDALGPGTVVGYCTNVHAGAGYAQTLENLERHALAVKAMVSPKQPMGVGLWLSAQTTREIIKERKLAELADWLHQRGLEAFTLNAFPYGDFHEPVVKHRVYEPDWSRQDRTLYTVGLVPMLAVLAGGREGSISTLPVGWPDGPCPPVDLNVAAQRLAEVASMLARLEASTGTLIHLDLEPEPGCILQRSEDVVRFIEDRVLLAPGADEAAVRRHLRVCHDICHAAVMYEEQDAALHRYRDAGIAVGKVQVSSAVRVPFDEMGETTRALALEQLRSFVEPRYLHQTMCRRGPGDSRFYQDLPDALSSRRPNEPPTGEWRVHFHVPIFLERLGLIETTRDQIVLAVRTALAMGVRHFEVETYAWNVLPDELRTADLATGIAHELRWLLDAVR